MCPSSSDSTKSAILEDHAVKRFAEDGVSFSINTDDPGVIFCTITDEFDIAEQRIGLTKEQLMESVSKEVHLSCTIYDCTLWVFTVTITAD